MNELRPDYFAEVDPVETVLRRIKGNFRRDFVAAAIAEDGIEEAPEAWLAHNLSQELKAFLGGQNPQLRGGEDLPDLLEGEVEVARITLLDSVHGEVISLRARRMDDGPIQLRIVDEYSEHTDEPIVLAREQFPEPLTAKEVLEVFARAEPSPCQSVCTLQFSSDFYPELDELADELGVKIVMAE